MSTLVSDILADVRARGYEVDQQVQSIAFINQVQRRIIGDHRWDFLIQTQTVAVTPQAGGTFSTALDSTVMDIESVRFATSAGGPGYPELEYRDVEDFIATANYQGNVSGFGMPVMWTTDANHILVWPSYQATGTLTIRSLKTVAPLTATTDAISIPDMYCDIITAGVCSLLAARERQIYVQQGWDTEYQDRLAAMKSQCGLKQRQTSHRVVTTGRFSDPYDGGAGWGW